jgi:hypothetical protein
MGWHRVVEVPQRSRGLPPALLLQDLGAQIDALVADVDTIRTGDEPAVPVRFLPPAEGANGVKVRAREPSVNHHRLTPSHAGSLQSSWHVRQETRRRGCPRIRE